jgi:hypothetical protein
MRVFDAECGGGVGSKSDVIAASSSGTIRIVLSASKNSWAVNATFALVPSRLASFRDGDVGPDVAAVATTGNNAAHLRHPPFRSGI